MANADTKTFATSKKAFNDSGFTLIEIMVAIAIAAIVMAIVSYTLISVMENREYLEKETDFYQSAQLILDMISKDFACAFVSSREDYRIFTGEDASYVGDDRDRVDFTALSHFSWKKDAKESDQCEVGYFVLDVAEEKTNYLMRRYDATIDTEPGDGGQAMELLKGIKSFNIRYYDGNEWKDQWSLENDVYLPYVVEITLELEDMHGDVVKFQNKVEIPLRSQ